MSARKFSSADDLVLCNSVRCFPTLYSRERFATKSLDVVRDSWRAVAAEVGRDEEACKKRWRDIRDHYFKVKRKQQLSKDHKWTPRWSLYKSLSFLANNKRKKRISSCEDLSNLSADVDIYEPEMTFKVEGDIHEASPLEHMDVKSSPKQENSSYRAPSDCGSIHFLEDPPPSWGPRTLLDAFSESRRPGKDDDVDVFMRSVALTVKRLSPKDRAEAKLRILSVVTELEFPNTSSAVDGNKSSDVS